MRLLIDECLPRAIKRLLGPHECRTVQEMGWSGLQNGDLLDAAEPRFDVLVTIDQSLQYQQNLIDRNIAILVLRGRSNQVEDLAPVIPDALAALERIQPGQVILIG